MSTFPTMPTLRKPQDREKVPSSVLAYLRTRNRMRIFNLIHREFKSSGLSQAVLADRLGIGTDRVCKLLAAPGNWTLDTVNDLLFVITGGVVDYSVEQPLDRPRRNNSRPDWLDAPVVGTSQAAQIQVSGFIS